MVRRRSRVPAIAALSCSAATCRSGAMQQQQAVEARENYAREQGLDDYTVSALPRPVSPFNWMVVVRAATSLSLRLRQSAPGAAAVPDSDADSSRDSMLPTSRSRLHAGCACRDSGIAIRASSPNRHGSRRTSSSFAGSQRIRCSRKSNTATHRPASGSGTCAFSRPGGTPGRSATACAAPKAVRGKRIRLGDAGEKRRLAP